MTHAHSKARRFAGLAATVALAAGAAFAQAPQQFNYQGRISDANGLPFATGSYCFSFGLWSAPDGGSKYWGDEIHEDIYVVDGYFNVILGAQSALLGKFQDASRYLSVRVGSECSSLGAEILPRQRVLASPFALVASDLVGKVKTRTDFGYAQLEGFGTSDQPTFRLGGTTTGTLDLQHPGGLSIRHQATTSGYGYSRWYGSNGSINAFVGVNSVDTGSLRLYNASSQTRVSMSAGTDDSGDLQILGPAGVRNVQASHVSGAVNHGLVAVSGPTFSQSSYFFVDSSRDAGSVVLNGPNGKLNVYLGTNASSHNGGGLSVADSNGTEQAGILVLSNGSGRVWGDEKNFVVKHPTRSGHKIVYTSQEGPEATISFSGRLALIDGKGTIDVPEHFAALAALDTVSVNLTPHDLASKGLAVATVARRGIVIGELFQGQGSYEVSFEVRATRADKQGRSAVITEDEFLSSFGLGGGAVPDVQQPEADGAGGIVDIEQQP